MKFSVGFFTNQRPPGEARSQNELYEDLLECAKLADASGLDSLWLAEHHFFPDGFMCSPLPVAAALLANTKRLRVAVDVLHSLYHPVRLAEDAIAIDILSRGRLLLGLVGTSWEPELATFGMPLNAEGERLDELLQILPRAFSGKQFAHAGKHYRIPSTSISPQPFTPGGPRLVLGAHGEPAEEAGRAGRHAAHYRTNPMWGWKDLERLVHVYDAARPAGMDGEVFISVYGFVSDRTDPWGEMEPGFRYVRKTYYDIFSGKPPAHLKSAAAGFASASGDEPLDRAAFGRLLLGNRTEVQEQVLRYRQQFGERTNLILKVSYPGMAQEKVLEAIEAYADVARQLG